LAAKEKQEKTKTHKLGAFIGTALMATYPIFSACARWHETLLDEADKMVGYKHIEYQAAPFWVKWSKTFFSERPYYFAYLLEERNEIRNTFWMFERLKYASIPVAALGAFILYKSVNQKEVKEKDHGVDVA
jgi:hypothetical protein